MFQRTTKQRFNLTDRRRITFYAAVFGEVTTIHERNQNGELITYKETILPDAFSDTLKSNWEVIADLDHDPQRQFAKRSDGSLLLQADPHGLWASCWIPNGSFGDTILHDIETGKLDGCSFKFAPVKDRTNGDIVERIAVNLIDVCLTATPAYDGTEVHLRHKQQERNNSIFTRIKLAKLRIKLLDTVRN